MSDKLQFVVILQDAPIGEMALSEQQRQTEVLPDVASLTEFSLVKVRAAF